MTKEADGTYKCSCGAVYTLETLPEQCTGTRDGRRCAVEHFGSWARTNARLKAVMPELKAQNDKVREVARHATDQKVTEGLKDAAAKVRDTPRMEVELSDEEKKILYGDPAKPQPYYGRPKWLDPALEEKQKAEFARVNAEMRASADRGRPDLEKLAEEIKAMSKKPLGEELTSPEAVENLKRHCERTSIHPPIAPPKKPLLGPEDELA